MQYSVFSPRCAVKPAAAVAGALVTCALLMPSGLAASDEQDEAFLTTAEVVASEPVGEGITNPTRLTLRLGEVEQRAIFKTVNRTIDQVSHAGGWEPKFTDKYMYEVAAYRIDRLLGIGLVPVTVVRTVDGVEGSVQMWIEDVTTLEVALAAHGDEPMENFDLFLERLMLTYVLDALIYNTDRNHSNILVDFDSDRFYPIDHSRAFRLHKKIPPMSATSISVPEAVANKLRALDLTTLQASLGDLLEAAQIKAIDKRRKALIKELERRGLI